MQVPWLIQYLLFSLYQLQTQTMYNGSNIFAKQRSHNLHLEGAHYPFPFKHFLICQCMSPGSRMADQTGQRSRLSLCCECWNLSASVRMCVCPTARTSPLPNPLLPEVSAHLQRREELVLNYKQVCFLPSFVLLIIPWARTVHNKGWNNKPLSCEKAGKQISPLCIIQHCSHFYSTVIRGNQAVHCQEG